jgi:signal transduction histidine kinase
MPVDIPVDVASIARIKAVPTILETIAELTGLGFVCVARVTEDSWMTCAVLDRLNFGLKPGDTLDLETTICKEVRLRRESVIIDKVSEDNLYRDHHTPKMYGFESYFSTPVYSKNGEYFGSLCGLDPQPKLLTTKSTVATLKLFAQLISTQLQFDDELAMTKLRLEREIVESDLREQFIAVLSHDLRNPLGSITAGADLLVAKNRDASLTPSINRIKRSASRIESLTNDLTDLVRGNLGDVLGELTPGAYIDRELEHVVSELNAVHKTSVIAASIEEGLKADCIPKRIAQLASNILKNAIDHGTTGSQVNFQAFSAGQKLVLTVTNQGTKIPDEKATNLFKPYWRDGFSPRNDGLGLGLYIAKEIAKAHGGSLSFRSTDTSTVFTFEMPQYTD